jgi:hypothetical protein
MSIKKTYYYEILISFGTYIIYDRPSLLHLRIKSKQNYKVELYFLDKNINF